MTIPIRSLVPFLYVQSVSASIAFYEKLGFTLHNTFARDGGPEPTWAWLESGAAAPLMLARATEPVIASQQAVLFYLYCDDVAGKHAELTSAGVECGPIASPFYAPKGEFRVTDPDGFMLMITHT
jgi:catechol 2,3-dioxygenase-like lactoylglutathione lyase family enzyme